jgi:hypothetical protein
MDWFLVFRRAMTFAVLFVIAGPAAAAEKRVALVIGNAAYAHATALKTPANDTELVAKTLHEIGFTDVLEQYNLGMAAMSTALETFGMRAEGADWAVIYYAGHGLELAGDGFPQARFARGLRLSGWRQGTAEVTVIFYRIYVPGTGATASLDVRDMSRFVLLVTPFDAGMPGALPVHASSVIAGRTQRKRSC